MWQIFPYFSLLSFHKNLMLQWAHAAEIPLITSIWKTCPQHFMWTGRFSIFKVYENMTRCDDSSDIAMLHDTQYFMLKYKSNKSSPPSDPQIKWSSRNKTEPPVFCWWLNWNLHLLSWSQSISYFIRPE